MRIRRTAAALAGAALLAPAGASGYPGGTPNYQTDAAPFCAGCHSSRSVEMLAGAVERAEKELAEAKHVAVILSGQKGYESLTEADRRTLAEHIRAADAAATVVLDAPESVEAGQTFSAAVNVSGGAGPVVGVFLVDRAHRWFARPAASAGWRITAAPMIMGPDGQPQAEWLERRGAAYGYDISYVNVLGIESDAATGTWSSAQVIYTIRAPERPGSYPLAAAFLYGTEKSSLLGYTTDALGNKKVRGGTAGASGRVLFTTVRQIQVQPRNRQPPAPVATTP